MDLNAICDLLSISKFLLLQMADSSTSQKGGPTSNFLISLKASFSAQVTIRAKIVIQIYDFWSCFGIDLKRNLNFSQNLPLFDYSSLKLFRIFQEKNVIIRNIGLFYSFKKPS
jgi:hypothetical protein